MASITRKWKRKQNQPELERFHESYEKTDGGCWIWKKFCKPGGYGQFKLSHPRRVVLAHRYAYMIIHGSESMRGLDICHHCDNPPCVNPEHLFLGTAADNIRDSMNKGRIAYGERHGNAKLTEDAVREIRRLRTSGVRGADIAQQFGVTRRHVTRIVHKKIWKSVGDVANS